MLIFLRDVLFIYSKGRVAEERKSVGERRGGRERKERGRKWEREKERDRRTDILHPLTYSPSIHSSHNWVRPKPRSESPT